MRVSAHCVRISSNTSSSIAMSLAAAGRRRNGVSAPNSRPSRAYSSLSVESTIRETKESFLAKAIECARSGTPFSNAMFLSGKPFEPLRAGTTAHSEGASFRESDIEVEK